MWALLSSFDLVPRSTRLRGIGFGHLFDDGEDVMIFDRLDLIGKRGEAAIDAVEFLPRELVTELLALATERVTARMLAQHKLVVRHAYGRRRHNLVGQAILDD